MNPDVQDLRILRLALLYEEAYEPFVRRVAQDLVSDPAVRRRLERLAPPGEAHAGRVRDLLEEVSARLKPGDALAAGRAALQDVVEVERAAREFYLRHLEELHDPSVVALFREMVREEGEHVREAERALEAHDARVRRAGLGPRLRRIHDALDAPGVPLRGGAGPAEGARDALGRPAAGFVAKGWTP